MSLTAYEKIKKKFEDKKHICVGLDTDLNKIPSYIKTSSNPFLEFNKIVIENTYQEAAAYKLNFAFYEKDGIKGIENLYKTLELIPDDVLVIADAKRGDIGNTSEMYAESIFNHFKCDSITLHPYMGFDSLDPFLKFKDKLNFILALTSNPGANDFEKLRLENGKYLFQETINKVNEWNGMKNCGIVFGATKIDELKENIKLFGELIVLLPGVGAQGGSLEEVVEVFESNNNKNYLINISRALIYCDNSPEFPTKIKEAAAKLNDSVRRIISERNDSI